MTAKGHFKGKQSCKQRYGGEKLWSKWDHKVPMNGEKSMHWKLSQAGFWESGSQLIEDL